MSQNLRYKFLEALEDGGGILKDIICAFQKDDSPWPNWNKEKEERKFYALAYRLKKKGLIRSKAIGRNCFVSITAEGRKLLKHLRDNEIPSTTYPLTKGDGVTVVSIRAPQGFRRKKFWIKKTLANLNFKFIQRGVWIGEGDLPEGFFEDLNYLKLNSFTKVFHYSKSGIFKEVNVTRP